MTNTMSEAVKQVLSAPQSDNTGEEKKFLAAMQQMIKLGYRFNENDVKLLRIYLSSPAGLLVLGNVGVGKTFFFKANHLPILNLTTIASHSLAEISEGLRNHANDEIVIDDLGAESQISHYGVKLDIIPEILESRLASPARTHITTNLEPEAILSRYGARVFDRIKELTRLVRFPGTSRREASGVRLQAVDFFERPLWAECDRRCKFYARDPRGCIKGVRSQPHRCEACPWF